MGISFDQEIGYLWAHCDNNCNNQANVLNIETNVGSPTLGKFILRAKFARPTTLGNFNHEGITFEPESLCVGGFKKYFWTDDDGTGGHSIRRDSIPCGHFL